MNVIEKMQEREDCVLGGFVLSTDEYPLDSNYCFVLKVSECKHFKREGIRKGSLVMIDTRIPFEDGEVNCCVNYKKENPFFQFSRHNDLGEAFEFSGQLCLIVTRVCGGNI